MNESAKPAPAWATARKRIEDLADAIGRYAHDPLGSIKSMREWASEICMQCDVLQWDENNRIGKCVDN